MIRPFLAVKLLFALATASVAAPPNEWAVKRVKSVSADFKKEGFKIREEFQGGVGKCGEKQMVKHQLFRGNEYWFWLGCNEQETRLAVKVYDENGRPVDVETKSGKGWSSARVLSPRTGTYSVVFVMEKKEGVENFSWAMTYGYRGGVLVPKQTGCRLKFPFHC